MSVEIPNYKFTWEDGTSDVIPFGFPVRGKMRGRTLVAFAEYMKYFQGLIDFKLSARGWCYQLEGFGVIDKGQFGSVQRWINICRKSGHLPMDFVAEESSRQFSGIEIPTSDNIGEHFDKWLNYAVKCENYFTPDWWDGEEYYIMMLVEKIDLVTLFEPICDEYHIPIANSKGWSSITQRASMVNKFKEAEEIGLTPVVLYCGDHDPVGLAISGFLRKNIQDLYKSTEYWGENLIIDRFGLNFEFIEEHNLTWIDNLTTGSGKRANTNNPMVADYVREYGFRKCEANALVVQPEASRKLCRDAIENYYGENSWVRFQEKRDSKNEEIYDHMKGTGIYDIINKYLEEKQ